MNAGTWPPFCQHGGRTHPSAAGGRTGSLARFFDHPAERWNSGFAPAVCRVLVYYAGGRDIHLLLCVGRARFGGGKVVASSNLSASLHVFADGRVLPVCLRVLPAASGDRAGSVHGGARERVAGLVAIFLVLGFVPEAERVTCAGSIGNPRRGQVLAIALSFTAVAYVLSYMRTLHAGLSKSRIS